MLVGVHFIMGHQFLFFLIPTPAHTFVQGTGKKRRNVSRAGFLHIFLPERDEELHTTIISRLQFIPQSGRSAPPHPPPHPPSSHSLRSPRRHQWWPRKSTVLPHRSSTPHDPGPNNRNIQYLLNLSLTLHAICVSFRIPSVSLSRADGSSLYSTNSIAYINTQFSKHYLLFLFAIILPLWSSRTLETHSTMGENSQWWSAPCLSHRTECYKVQDWERRGDRGPGTIRRHEVERKK